LAKLAAQKEAKEKAELLRIQIEDEKKKEAEELAEKKRLDKLAYEQAKQEKI
tara:strand:+ start:385 stop:540 length:156 start_codon:yes stop_codon:yes gene_type:complete